MQAAQPLIKAALFIIAAQFFSVLLGATIKEAHESLPLEMTVFFRNLAGWLVLFPFVLRSGISNLKTEVVGWHLFRAIAGLGAMYTYFYVVGELMLASATTLMMTAPIIIPFVAFFVLGERLSSAAMIASLIGFVGVVAILQPQVEASSAVFVGLVGSVLVAFSQVSIRKLALTEPTIRIVFYFTSIALMVSTIPLLWSWQTPGELRHWGLLAVLGVVATLSQLCLAQGYALAPVSRVGVFLYTSVFFAVAMGWLFWGELWDSVSIAGAGLIIGAGLMVLTRHKYSQGIGKH